jgi:hypothetical protein
MISWRKLLGVSLVSLMFCAIMPFKILRAIWLDRSAGSRAARPRSIEVIDHAGHPYAWCVIGVHSKDSVV